MISVKGTTTSDPALPGEEFLEREPVRRSRVPYLVGAVLSAVVLYIKSAMPGSAATAAADPGAGGAPRKAGLADTQDQLAGAGGYGKPDPATGERRLKMPDQDVSPPADFFDGAGIRFGSARALPRPPAANVDSLPMTMPQEIDVLQGIDLQNQTRSSDGPADRSSGGGQGSGSPVPRKKSPPAILARTPYLMEVKSGAITAIALTDLLATVDSASGAALQVVDAAVNSGTLVPTAGGYLYQSDPDFVGEVELRYKVTDGTSVITQVAKLSVDRGTGHGGGADTPVPDADPDKDPDGPGGDDDTVAGGTADIAHGGAGDDLLQGGAGADRIFGEDGHDIIFGRAGDDWISGGKGDDSLYGEDGNDTLSGDAGDDLLSDGMGSDSVSGGEGHDVVLAAADSTNDRFDGGDGTDTLDYSGATSAMVIDLIAGVAKGVGIGEDDVLNFEIIIAGSGDDNFIVGRGELTLSGGEGNDRFEFVGTEPGDAVIQTIHQILDFDVGDRIVAKGLELFERSDDDDRDLPELRENDPAGTGPGAQIRLTYEQFEDYDQTVIEWDSDGTDDLTTVLLEGRHVLVWSSTASLFLRE